MEKDSYSLHGQNMTWMVIAMFAMVKHSPGLTSLDHCSFQRPAPWLVLSLPKLRQEYPSAPHRPCLQQNKRLDTRQKQRAPSGRKTATATVQLWCGVPRALKSVGMCPICASPPLDQGAGLLSHLTKRYLDGMFGNECGYGGDLELIICLSCP
jgi:hypothetical protein